MAGYVVGPQQAPEGTHEHLMDGDSDFATFDPNALAGTKIVWASSTPTPPARQR
jgi:hypothetical protein